MSKCDKLIIQCILLQDDDELIRIGDSKDMENKKYKL